MSKYHKSSNPFEDDEDDGDFSNTHKTSYNQTSTGRPPSSGGASSTNSRSGPGSSYQSSQRSAASYSHQPSSQYYEENSPFDDRLSQLQMKIANSENTQLESTQRALSSIYESEAMGVATAEELLRQADTLNNIENKTDNMQQNMKVSQRHLNNIKSVFGGIKNWWGGDKKPAEVKPPESANSRLRETVAKSEKSKANVGGFYENDDDLDSQSMSRKSSGGQYTMITPVTRSAREEEVDNNLGLMLDGMTRLKGLALGLGDEIERQNDQLDRINDKVVKTDDLITHQNTQMKRILKK